MRKIFFFSVLLAATISTPLAFGVVAMQWARMDLGGAAAFPLSAAVWSARTFIASFDMLVLITWLPCAIWISRSIARLRISTSQVGL
jgi:hypothetical protein